MKAPLPISGFNLNGVSYYENISKHEIIINKSETNTSSDFILFCFVCSFTCGYPAKQQNKTSDL